jgi:hypothetical protein
VVAIRAGECYNAKFHTAKIQNLALFSSHKQQYYAGVAVLTILAKPIATQSTHEDKVVAGS